MSTKARITGLSENECSRCAPHLERRNETSRPTVTFINCHFDFAGLDPEPLSEGHGTPQPDAAGRQSLPGAGIILAVLLGMLVLIGGLTWMWMWMWM